MTEEIDQIFTGGFEVLNENMDRIKRPLQLLAATGVDLETLSGAVLDLMHENDELFPAVAIAFEDKHPTIFDNDYEHLKRMINESGEEQAIEFMDKLIELNNAGAPGHPRAFTMAMLGYKIKPVGERLATWMLTLLEVAHCPSETSADQSIH